GSAADTVPHRSSRTIGSFDITRLAILKVWQSLIVTVRQRGVLLDEVSVAPGPFVLNDLFATGYGGDLTVTVTEAAWLKRELRVRAEKL
ncbi:fimbria/pilus outer membrane usher protein, partial [Klebsiella pneumoniae]|uniref:fimbria/pilus outer membrane usher protein n=1 Tax=Klebsiella pneumoniae TaxID=573 RepID=UPI00272FAC9C